MINADIIHTKLIKMINIEDNTKFRTARPATGHLQNNKITTGVAPVFGQHGASDGQVSMFASRREN